MPHHSPFSTKDVSGTIRRKDAQKFGEMACEKAGRTGRHMRGAPGSRARPGQDLDEAAVDTDTGTIVAGGGDGIYDLAACHRLLPLPARQLGVIAGTMNLFARRPAGCRSTPPAANRGACNRQPVKCRLTSPRPMAPPLRGHQFRPECNARMVRLARPAGHLHPHAQDRLHASKNIGRRVILHPSKSFAIEIDTGFPASKATSSRPSPCPNQLVGDTPLSPMRRC